MEFALPPASDMDSALTDLCSHLFERASNRLDLLQLLAANVARAYDAAAAGGELGVGHDGQAADRLPAQPLDLERVHAHLGRREGAARVVLVDGARDRLEVLRLGTHG